MLMPCFQQTLRILNMQLQSAAPQINTEHPRGVCAAPTLLTLRVRRAPPRELSQKTARNITIPSVSLQF